MEEEEEEGGGEWPGGEGGVYVPTGRPVCLRGRFVWIAEVQIGLSIATEYRYRLYRLLRRIIGNRMAGM